MHECQKDLNNNYKNVPEEHAKLQERVSATDLLITNIEKTVVELEKSITQTHEDQIENLNNKMKELWMNTYRGGDIDHIALRTDKDKGTTGPSYNYRVVMSKDGKEINMRGRFSAGQKVLASIIVRLALAEIFCLDCSILSLDEPTTNLDKENSRSLAEALVELIKGRSKQKNFQLILITHDEEFVEILARSGLIQVCHRVAKNSSQYSQLIEETF
ncbi:P-loop containing nucleoside triphosphate hydrolase protein [Spinellus fusiger]|nr:P-loop containing nucleoside triphosphate hydrolase protein [Spinellus fusiger]